MATQTKQERIKEIEYQTQMLHNLQRWIRNLLILSSVMLVIAYWAFQWMNGTLYIVIGTISIIVLMLSIIGCVVIGLGFKRGKENIQKINLTL